jgi:hypothetical protein
LAEADDLFNFLGNQVGTPTLICRRFETEDQVVRKAAIGLAAAGALAVSLIASPGSVEARGFGRAFAGGLVAGAVIGGIASSAYAWGPGYAYDDGYGPGYDGGYGPGYYAPGYYGPGYYGYRSQCPEPGYGEYYNCGVYAMPGYGSPTYW